MNEITRAEGMQRLRTLYALIAGLPKYSLDLRTWRATRASEGGTLDNKHLISEVNVCGTTACAVGWACAYPEFVELGLKFIDNQPVVGIGTRKLEGWSAVEAFFALSQCEAMVMFMKPKVLPLRYAHVARNLTDKEILGNGSELSDFRLVLMRIRRMLALEGVISAEREDELVYQELSGNFEFVEQ